MVVFAAAVVVVAAVAALVVEDQFEYVVGEVGRMVVVPLALDEGHWPSPVEAKAGAQVVAVAEAVVVVVAELATPGVPSDPADVVQVVSQAQEEALELAAQVSLVAAVRFGRPKAPSTDHRLVQAGIQGQVVQQKLGHVCRARSGTLRQESRCTLPVRYLLADP